MNWKKALIFALLVTLGGQTLDIIAHLAAGTIVHIPYVTAKTMVIASSLFLLTWWAGANWKHGIVMVLIASSLFYMYYLFAEPTLDRAVFTLDEQFKWVFIHWVAIYFPYLLGLGIADKAGLRPAPYSKKIFYYAAMISGVLAVVFLLGLDFMEETRITLGLRFNDRVLVGTLAAVVAVAAGYRLALFNKIAQEQ